MEIEGRRILFAGDIRSDTLIVQCAANERIEAVQAQYARAAELIGDAAWGMAAIGVDDWNVELAPWPAPPVFGRESFGSGAGQTLVFILNRLLPAFPGARRIGIGGYSLAGLFALWAAGRCDAFRVVAAVSPSLWYPGWAECSAQFPVRAEYVYLSLGDREARAKNPVLARVGDALQRERELLSAQGVENSFEWNPGNHFADVDMRMAKGIAHIAARLKNPPAGVTEP